MLVWIRQTDRQTDSVAAFVHRAESQAGPMLMLTSLQGGSQTSTVMAAAQQCVKTKGEHSNMSEPLCLGEHHPV